MKIVVPIVDPALTNKGIASLSAEQQAAYWLGVAIFKELDFSFYDDETRSVLAEVLSWAQMWLDDDALAIVSDEIGIPLTRVPDDDIPF